MHFYFSSGAPKTTARRNLLWGTERRTKRKVHKPLKEMAPQVGLERCPEFLTAETILLKFLKNTRKTSTDAGFGCVRDLP